MTDLPLPDGFFATPHRFLWHRQSRTAILADLHLGIDRSLAAQGFSLPDTSTAGLLTAWQALVDRRPREIVIAGDLFDAPAVVDAAMPLFRALVGAVPADCRLTILPGNHDPSAEALGVLLEDPRIGIRPAATVGGYAVFHGHQSADARGIGEGRWHPSAEQRDHWLPRGVIVGHQHPAVTLATRVQSAKMICYAQATLHVDGRSVEMLLLPAFSRAPLGSNLLTQRHWILDLPRPGDEEMRILGLVEPRNGAPQVLDFGPLAALPTA